jgi:MazG family protein
MIQRKKVKETKTDRWNAIEEILRIIERLRSETGCPWDRKQTPETIQTYLVEESHEAAAAVRAKKVDEVAEELGDVLFMAFFLVYLYEQRGDFSLEEVCRRVSEKMIRRHPHVFGETSVSSAEEVKDNWEMIKAQEKRASGKTQTEPVPDSLPALIRAHRILSRLSQKDDANWNDLLKQGREFAGESKELASKIESGRLDSEDDLGRLLARLVNIARLKGYRAEDILHNFLRKLE